MKPIKVNVKPLSVNQAYRGRRFKTTDYKKYIEDVSEELEDYLKVERGEKLTMLLLVDYSNSASDIDNCLKPFIDILQKYYDFNDNKIFEILINKNIVPKGEEGIEFLLFPYDGLVKKIWEGLVNE